MATVATISTRMDAPEFVDRQGTNARDAFERHFTRDESIDRYYEFLT